MKEWTLGTATECVNFGGASSSITTHYQTCWDGTYYWRNYYTFADGKHTLHLMRSADAITWTEITTYTPSDGYDVAGDSDPIVCIKYYNNNVYMIFKREDVSLNQRVSILKWDGSSLSVSNYDFSLTTITGYGGAARNLILIGLDICLINTTLYVMLHIQPSQYGAGAAKGYGATVFTSITGTYITKLTNNDYMSTGSGGSSYYYFLAAPSSAGAAATTIKKYSFNGSAIALVADYSSYFAITDVSYSETTHSYVMDVYYQTNQTEIFFAQSFLYWRSNTTSNWNIIELSDTATGNIGFDYLSINVLEWIYFAQGTKTWGFYISTQGGILILKHLSATAINYITEYSHHILLSAYNGFFVQTLAKTTIVSTYANTAYVVPKMDTLNYISVAQLYNYALDDEEGILLYDDSDNLIFMGYTDLDTIQSNNSSEVGLRLTSPMNNDLATTYSGTFTAGTAPETVISTVLGTCKFCSAGTLSASGLTLAGAITYQNTPKSKIITDMLKLMARCVEINSALSISAKSTPTDSTKTLTFETISSSSGYNISELSKKKIKASNVKLRYGPSLTLYEQRGTAANEYEIQDLYPQITSATEIARIATQLLSTITPYYELVIDVWGNGKFTAGQSLVFSHTPESIPEETYYIVAENYNSTSGVAQIRIVNLIKYPIQNQIQQIQTQLDVVTTTANNALPSTTAATTYVSITGNQTITGTKTIGTDTKLQFRDANTYIYSEAANALNLYSANYIRFNAATAEYIANNNVPLSILNSAGSWKECFKLDSSNLLNIGKDVSVYLPNKIGYVKIGDGTANAKKLYIDSQSSDYSQVQLGNSNGECSITYIGHKSAFGTGSTIASSNGNNEIFVAGVGIYNANCLRWAIGNKGYGNWMFAVDYAGQAWFKTAWISIDRQWSDYPSITIHSEANDASKRELRVHGINTSMEGASSGSDFSVNMVIDGTTYGTSDRRKKTDITDLKYGLTDLLKLKPVSYHLRNKDLTVEPELRIGFIAQDVMEVIPEAVIYHKDEDVPLENGWCSAYAISDQPILATAIKAIQDLHKQNLTLQEQIKDLQEALLLLQQKVTG